MGLKKIRLELARTPNHPEGSSNYGYEFVAPLDAAGHIDLDGYHHNRKRCTVHRFWAGQPDEHGLLHHTRGGTRGGRWVFDYDDDSDDDEPLFKLDRHVFAEGEYLSITEHDGVQRTFRIAWIKPIVV